MYVMKKTLSKDCLKVRSHRLQYSHSLTCLKFSKCLFNATSSNLFKTILPHPNLMKGCKNQNDYYKELLSFSHSSQLQLLAWPSKFRSTKYIFQVYLGLIEIYIFQTDPFLKLVYLYQPQIIPNFGKCNFFKKALGLFSGSHQSLTPNKISEKCR